MFFDVTIEFGLGWRATKRYEASDALAAARTVDSEMHARGIQAAILEVKLAPEPEPEPEPH